MFITTTPVGKNGCNYEKTPFKVLVEGSHLNDPVSNEYKIFTTTYNCFKEINFKWSDQR